MRLASNFAISKVFVAGTAAADAGGKNLGRIFQEETRMAAKKKAKKKKH
jgi:hypothetical protein